MSDEEDQSPSVPLTLWQRSILRRARRRAKKGKGEPLTADDWVVMWGLEHTYGGRAVRWLWRSMPSETRCMMCAAPFSGPGKAIASPLGYRPSRKNPHVCSTCVELSPPGGATTDTGILFADLRGFTSASEGATPEQVSTTLRRFYGCAEQALLPMAIIDKLIGDEVMAIYPHQMLSQIPVVGPAGIKDIDIPAILVDHARRLLGLVGYGTEEGPFVEVGIGLDYGEAYVGNIGDRDVYDFTAVGDVVNTASRLQGQAAGGEIVMSERVASRVEGLGGERVSLELKGKAEPLEARRLSGADALLSA